MENKNSLPFSKQHEQAVKLHNRIMASASLAQQSLWEMCTGLKQIIDGSIKVYGKQLCLKCVRNLVKAAKENAAPAVSE